MSEENYVSEDEVIGHYAQVLSDELPDEVFALMTTDAFASYTYQAELEEGVDPMLKKPDNIQNVSVTCHAKHEVGETKMDILPNQDDSKAPDMVGSQHVTVTRNSKRDHEEVSEVEFDDSDVFEDTDDEKWDISDDTEIGAGFDIMDYHRRKNTDWWKRHKSNASP